MERFKGQPRLPKFAVPKSYDIRLKPDLSACKFAGLVSIDLDIVANTKFIVLNAAELSVTHGSFSFTNQGYSKSKVSPIRLNFHLPLMLNNE
jgi:puromycin-sensitive aminopeptidase